MDSMRTLNTSLPKDTAAKPSEEVLQAFRDAALSVTNLYKAATGSQQRERAAGYQDALEDLISFLDKENLGLQDGEGWRVRQWATERLDRNGGLAADGSESEDERESPRQGEISQVNTTSDGKEIPDSSPAPESREEVPTKEPVVTIPAEQPLSLQNIKTEPFTFRSDMQYPRDVDMSNQNPTTATASDQGAVNLPSQTSTRSRRLRNTSSAPRQNLRSTVTRSLGPGSGSKRKFTFGDFFDPRLFDGKDGGAGGGLGGAPKRGRTG